LSRRNIKPELLEHAEPSEARGNLADLVRINRYFGGHSTISRMLEQVVQPEEPFTVLDVGAASGDTAEMIVRWYPQARVTSLDNSAVNLETAPRPKLLADAFQLPFPPRSFDFVISSLFLHHFPDELVTALLRSFRLLARRGVLIADLERHIFPLLFLRLSKPVFGWRRITVHDGLRSIRAAFRPAELKKLAEAAGIDSPFVEVHRPAFRLTLLAADLRASALHPVSQ
jgi:ubiquinone/menaquinone biosynthesis C-methylase UbiE